MTTTNRQSHGEAIQEDRWRDMAKAHARSHGRSGLFDWCGDAECRFWVDWILGPDYPHPPAGAHRV